MSSEFRVKVREIFADAMDLPEDEREEFIRRACGDVRELREEVEHLLNAAKEAGVYLACPTVGEIVSVDPSDADQGPEPKTQEERRWGASDHRPGEMIGRYKLLQCIGEGGFGSVWMAEQKEPVKRRVALKIIKLGMDTKQVIARFEAERQALAMMDHPNIARVFDAGATDAGRPFFVMELVRGVPIMEYCDTARLDTQARLQLFVQVCNAIQHAHQKGVIHRDIKPSNVMITLHDGEPVAKVIDFGIAKATNTELTKKTLFTEFRQMIGTPAYMSPEQAEMSGLDIDTRSDVYSLGVLLYELLTGTKPFNDNELASGGYAEMMRIICEVEPHKPSTRVSSLGDAGSRTAELRRVDLRKLRLLLTGDLDWIVMKCLEKDRTRRYETANGLVTDVQRHILGEPVIAAPPSRSYRMKKFVRRNRAAVTTGVTITLLLVIGFFGTTWGMYRAQQAMAAEAKQREVAEINERRAFEEAERAEREARRAEAEAERAVVAEAEAQQRADDLELVARFQASQLAGIATERMGNDIRENILNKKREILIAGGADEAAIEAALAELKESLLGVNFTSIALDALDEHIFERAMTAINEQFEDQPQVRGRLLQTLADTMVELGLLNRALVPQTEALEIYRELYGDEHRRTLASMTNKGVLLQHLGRLEEAEEYLRQALETRLRVFGEGHAYTVRSFTTMGGIQMSRGRFAEAEEYFRQALEAQISIAGPDSEQVVSAMGNLGLVLGQMGRLSEAEPYLRDSLEQSRRLYGDDDPKTIISINNLGALLMKRRRLTEAEALMREAMEANHRVLGDDHIETLLSMDNLGTVLADLKRFDEAEAHYLAALEGRRLVLGDEHPHTLLSAANLGTLYTDMGRLDEAAHYHRMSLDLRRRTLGNEHVSTLISMSNLCLTLYRLGEIEEAIELAEELVDTASRALPEDHGNLAFFLNVHGTVLVGMKRYADAESSFLDAQEIFMNSLGPEHWNTINNMRHLVVLYRNWHQAEPEGGYDVRAEEWRENLPERWR